MLLASLDEREVDSSMLDHIVALGGAITNRPGESRRVPHSLIVGIAPEIVDDVRPAIEAAHRRHFRESAAAGSSTHASKHRPDLLRYLRDQARELGVGA